MLFHTKNIFVLKERKENVLRLHAFTNFEIVGTVFGIFLKIIRHFELLS